jgi:hypothetical protein
VGLRLDTGRSHALLRGLDYGSRFAIDIEKIIGGASPGQRETASGDAARSVVDAGLEQVPHILTRADRQIVYLSPCIFFLGHSGLASPLSGMLAQQAGGPTAVAALSGGARVASASLRR